MKECPEAVQSCQIQITYMTQEFRCSIQNAIIACFNSFNNRVFSPVNFQVFDCVNKVSQEFISGRHILMTSFVVKQRTLSGYDYARISCLLGHCFCHEAKIVIYADIMKGSHAPLLGETKYSVQEVVQERQVLVRFYFYLHVLNQPYIE